MFRNIKDAFLVLSVVYFITLMVKSMGDLGRYLVRRHKAA